MPLPVALLLALLLPLVEREWAVLPLGDIEPGAERLSLAEAEGDPDGDTEARLLPLPHGEEDPMELTLPLPLAGASVPLPAPDGVGCMPVPLALPVTEAHGVLDGDALALRDVGGVALPEALLVPLRVRVAERVAVRCALALPEAQAVAEVGAVWLAVALPEPRAVPLRLPEGLLLDEEEPLAPARDGVLQAVPVPLGARCVKVTVPVP